MIELIIFFCYRDKGSLAVIGRNAAVANIGSVRFAGFSAWLAWLFIHLWFLIEFDNKLLVLIQWAWNYFTRKRGARLITGEEMLPQSENPKRKHRPDSIEPQTTMTIQENAMLK